MPIRPSASRAKPQPTALAHIDETLDVILSVAQRKPARHLPRRLDALFRDLSTSTPGHAPDDVIEMIWALWISHPDQAAADAMAVACDTIARGESGAAAAILDDLVARYPDWAEAWNKRAIVAFIAQRDADAIADIARVLALEPRHFGALSGYGQICLRHGRPAEARAALRLALDINPHLWGLDDLIAGTAGQPALLQ